MGTKETDIVTHYALEEASDITHVFGYYPKTYGEGYSDGYECGKAWNRRSRMDKELNKVWLALVGMIVILLFIAFTVG